MEPLLALAFAANVVQFVDFTTRLLSRTITIYRSKQPLEDITNATDLHSIGLQVVQYADPFLFDKRVREYLEGKPVQSILYELEKDKLEEQNRMQKKAKPRAEHKWASRFTRRHDQFGHDHHLRRDVNDDEDIRTALEGGPDLETVTRMSSCDKEILRTCLGCRAVALELRDAIKKLKRSKARSVWSSLEEALKTVWRDKQLHDLRLKLENYRQQMNTLLLVSLRYVMTKLRVLKAKENSEKIETSMEVQKRDHRDLYHVTRDMRSAINAMFSAQDQWKAEIIQAMQRNYPRQTNSINTVPGTSMQKALTPESNHYFNKSMLRWLCFTELETRYAKIEQAYKQTFEWIYRPPRDGRWSDFTKWLGEEDESLYWITGKPAAGKSTLMKFIYNDPRTIKHLKQWAGGRKLIQCAFYFWNSGTRMQMSEEGMLRTLIYTALQQAPELWAILFPSKMEEYLLFADPWLMPITSDELNHAFRFLLERAGTDYRLFFFIDGLDEFGGKHDRLLAMIQRLMSPDSKICVSSRAWPIFEDGFRGQPGLRLEALTYDDIKHYVTTRFSNSPGYQERLIETPKEINQLVEAVTSKASGVFLWVRLVTDSLLKGLEHGDRLEELQERLENIPGDLERLFEGILTNVDQERRGHVSQLLQVMRGSQEQLTVLEFSYADDEDPGVVAKAGYGSLDPQLAKARALRFRRRLKVCCKGLLEAEAEHGQPIYLAHVTYLHRTVRDYIERPEVWCQILSQEGDDSNPALRLHNVYAMRIKMNSETGSILTDFWQQVLQAIKYATRVDPKDSLGLQVRLLKQLDDIATHAIKKRLTDFPSSAWDAISVRMRDREHWSSLRKGGESNASFMHLAIQLQLAHYVQWQIQEEKKALPPKAEGCQRVKPDYNTATDGCQILTSFITSEEANLRLLMATLHYDSFAKDPAFSKVNIVPTSPSLDLIALLLQQGADPNQKIEGALKSHHNNSQYGNATSAYSVWECHLRETARASRNWISVSMLLLEHKADPSLVTNTKIDTPREVLVLAMQMARDQRTEIRKQKFRRFGSVFKVEKLRKPSSARIAVN